MNRHKEYIERQSPIDNIQSAYNELLKSHEYADEDMFTTEQLKEKGRYWLGELQNPLRSARNLEEVNQLVNLLLFEIAVRNGEVDSLESYYKIPDVA